MGVTSTQLAAGQTYTGLITVSGPTEFNGTISGTLPVSLQVGGAASATLAAASNPLNFTAQPGLTAPSQNDPITFNGQPVAVNSVAISTSTGQSWLQASVGSSSVFISANPVNLASGTYFGTVTANTSQGSLLIQVNLQVNLTGSGIPNLTVNPGTLSFAYQTGTAAPLPQTISLLGNGGTVNVSASTSGAQGWLFVTPTGQTATPATINVVVVPTGLGAGAYTGNIQISASAGFSSGTVNIPVNLLVSNSEVLEAFPSSLTFTAAPGGSVASQNLTVFGSGPSPFPLGYTTSASVTSPVGGSWLQVPSLSGATTATAGTLPISISAAGLASGTYTGIVNLSSPSAGNTAVAVPVTLIVASSGVVANPSSLSFNLPATSNPTSQNLAISLNGQPEQILSVLFSTTSGETWLTANSTSQGNVQVTVNPALLNTGSDLGTVVVTTPDGQVSVYVNIATQSSNGSLSSSPGSLSFNVAYGAGPTQGSFIAEGSGAPISVSSVSASTTTGAGWLQPSVLSASTGVVGVQVNPSSPSLLQPGSYSGTVLVNTSFGQLQVPVTLSVASLAASQNPVFSLPLGSGASSANVIITLNGAPTTLTGFAATTTTGQAWLTGSISGTSGGVTVTVNPQILSSAGVYQGTVSVSTPAGNIGFGVTLNYGVGSTSGLVASPSAVNFNIPLAGSGASPQSVNFTYNGVPVSSVAVSPGLGWLMVSNAGTGVVTVSINGAAFETPGTYTANFTVNTSAGTLIIPVTVTVGSGS